MLPQRSGPRRQGRAARRLVVPVAVTAVAALAGCSGGSDGANSGPPRVSPAPESAIAAEMINDKLEPQKALNACELLDLSPARVIELTDADMPEVEPAGSGELGLLCTYGGPGSPERYEAEQDEAEQDEAEEEAVADGAAGSDTSVPTTSTQTDQTQFDQTQTDQTQTGPPQTSQTQTSQSRAGSTPTSARGVDDPVPDTFAAGVVKPRSGAGPALADQATLLSNRLACSEVRGEEAATIEGAAPGAPEAPALANPEPATAYIDCVAGPTGGGVEVHTIFVADNDLWHLTLVKPGTPRSPGAEAAALAGLHRVAEHVLA